VPCPSTQQANLPAGFPHYDFNAKVNSWQY